MKFSNVKMGIFGKNFVTLHEEKRRNKTGKRNVKRNQDDLVEFGKNMWHVREEECVSRRKFFFYIAMKSRVFSFRERMVKNYQLLTWLSGD